MPTLEFKISGQHIERVDDVQPVAKSREYINAHFEFLTPEWAGIKTAIFSSGDGAIRQPLDDDGNCIVPWEFWDTDRDLTGYVSVFCGDLVTADRAPVRMRQSGYQETDEGREPTPDEYQQLVERVETATQEVKAAAKSTAEDRTAVENAKADIDKAAEAVAAEGVKQVETVTKAGQSQVQNVRDAVSDLAITPKATGMQIVARDSSNLPLKALTVYGRTEQDKTTGAIVNAGQNGNIEVTVAGKNLMDIYGFSALGMLNPNSPRSLSNAYGTTISTTEKEDELVVTQEIKYDATAESYDSGYFCIGITRKLEIGKTYKISFDMDVIKNPLSVHSIFIQMGGRKSNRYEATIENGRVMFIGEFKDDTQIEGSKKMLHYKHNNNNRGIIGQDVAFEKDVTYTFSFAYSMVSGAYNQSSGMYAKVLGKGLNGSIGSVNAGYLYSSAEQTGSAKGFMTERLEGNEVKGIATYTFTWAGESGTGSVFFHVPANQSAEFYLADISLYKSTDGTKTNLLKSIDETGSFNGWLHTGAWPKNNATTWVCNDEAERFTATIEACDVEKFYAGMPYVEVRNRGMSVKIRNFMITDENEDSNYEPYRPIQTATIACANGLPGIPVSSGGNYTDDSGQQWICDTIEYRDGQAVHVKRVWTKTFDGREYWGRYYYKNGFWVGGVFPEPMTRREGICSMLMVVKDSAPAEEAWFGNADTALYVCNSRFYNAALSDYGLANWKAYLADHPMTIMTYLTTATETPLTDTEAAQLAALHTYKPTTTVTNDAGVGMDMTYIADTKVYIDTNYLPKNFAVVNSWADVQNVVRLGMGNLIFPVGYEFTTLDSNTGNDIVWVVRGHNYHKAADESLKYTMTLETKRVYSKSSGAFLPLQFSAPQAAYYAADGLSPGTYHFTGGSLPWSTSAAGQKYQFTINNAIPAGGQIVINVTPTNDYTGGKMYTFSGGASSTPIESNIVITKGEEGAHIGSLYSGSENMNFSNRVIYGSNNYAQSAVRQWLNSCGTTGSAWTPATNFDRSPEWTSSTPGFMGGLPADFLEVVQPAIVPCRTNMIFEVNSCDGTTFGIDVPYTLQDKFFLLSAPEIWSISGLSPLTYYHGLTDSDRIKYDHSGAKRSVWLRTHMPKMTSVHEACYITSGGVQSVIGGAANSFGTANTNGACPACIIA